MPRLKCVHHADAKPAASASTASPTTSAGDRADPDRFRSDEDRQAHLVNVAATRPGTHRPLATGHRSSAVPTGQGTQLARRDSAQRAPRRRPSSPSPGALSRRAEADRGSDLDRPRQAARPARPASMQADTPEDAQCANVLSPTRTSSIYAWPLSKLKAAATRSSSCTATRRRPTFGGESSLTSPRWVECWRQTWSGWGDRTRSLSQGQPPTGSLSIADTSTGYSSLSESTSA